MGWKNTVDKREQILNAAEVCLRERGLVRLNIRDVAKEAGVSLGSVHYYFTSKEHILLEIFDQFVMRISKATIDSAKDANPRQVIIDFVNEFFNELAKDPDACHIFIDLWSHVTKHEDLHGIVDSYYRKSLDWLTDLIKEGKRQGLFQVDSPAFAAAHIIAIIDGLKVQLHLFGSELDLNRMKNSCKKFILNALQQN